MNKKIKNSFLLVAIVIMSGIFIAATNNYSKPKNIKEKAQYSIFLRNTNDSSKAVAKVNSKTITKNDIENTKLFRQDNLSDQQILDLLIKNELIKEEATNLGANVTLDEAKQEALKQRNICETLASNEDKNEVLEIIKGLGLTVDEYWNEYVPKEYQKVMTINRVKNIIAAKALEMNMNGKTNNNNLTPAEKQKIEKEAIRSFEDDLVRKAKIEYFSE